MSQNVPATAKEIYELVTKTEVMSIPSLPQVRGMYVQNYNTCNPGSNGEYMYERNMAYLQQILNSSDHYKNCSRWSIYVCMTTIAAYGYSIDPADDHIYLIPRKGVLCISKQAGAHLLRLFKTKQIIHNSEVMLVYEGDTFKKKDGLIIEHEENMKSERIIGGYVKFTLDEKLTQRHMFYRLSDFEAWRAKSDMPEGSNWRFAKTGQPHPGFLRTKIMSHACRDRCWIPGNNPIIDAMEINSEVFTEDMDYNYEIVGDEPEKTTEHRNDDAKAATDSKTAPQSPATNGAPANTATNTAGERKSFLKPKPENIDDKPF